MATTCFDDEGRCSPVAPVPPDDGAGGAAFAPIRPDPIADGSQVLAHDGYDVQLWDEAARAYPRLGTDLRKHAGELVTAPPLLRDLFWSFHQRAPQVAPPVPLTPAHAPNRGIVEQVLGTVEWAATRVVGTVGDPLAAALDALVAKARAVVLKGTDAPDDAGPGDESLPAARDTLPAESGLLPFAEIARQRSA